MIKVAQARMYLGLPVFCEFTIALTKPHHV